MLKQLFKERKFWLTFAAGAGALGLIAGALLPIEKLKEASQSPSGVVGSLQSFGAKPENVGAPSRVISPLVAQSPAQRAGTLKEASQKLNSSLERNRARYLLASDLVAQGQGEKALEPLKNLEKDYAVLAPDRKSTRLNSSHA